LINFYFYCILETKLKNKIRKMSEQIISKEGYEKLKNELNNLINVKRRDIAGRIQKAKDMGDLSENAEYSEAKDAQALNEGRIIEVSQLLKNVTVVEGESNGSEITLGSKIEVEVNGVSKEFEIVSFNEVDPAAGKISNESPLGQSFIGKTKDDLIMIKTPGGEKVYKIIKIK